MRPETDGLSIQTKAFVGVAASIGVVVLGYSLFHWQSHDLMRFLCYLAVAVLASGLKVQLPGIDGTMSVNFLFILLGVMELSLPETLVIGCTATLVQSVWQARKRLDPVKVLFNVAGMMANASALTYVSYHWLSGRFGSNKPILLMVAALVFFFANTLPISVVIALTEGKSSRKVWSECYFWSFPYYLVGAAAVGLVGIVNRSAGWETSLLVLPLIYWVYRSYRLYLGRLEAEKERVEVEKRHVEEIASLNMRTIEALALAIEAKDHTTHTHLQRVRIYAVAVAKELNLSDADIEALRCRIAARYREAGRAGTDHQQAGAVDAGRIRKDEGTSAGGSGDSGARRISLSCGADRAIASRTLGWNGISRGYCGREHPDRGTYLGGGRLPGRAGLAPAVSAGAASG